MLGQSLAGPGALTLPGEAGAAADPGCLETLQETLLQLLLTIHPLLLVPGAMSPIALPLCQVRAIGGSSPPLTLCEKSASHYQKENDSIWKVLLVTSGFQAE